MKILNEQPKLEPFVDSLATRTFRSDEPSLTRKHFSSGPIFRSQLSSGWSAEVFDQLAAIDGFLWRSLVPPSWKDVRYFQTLEEVFAREFTQFYLVLRDEMGRARVLQTFFLVNQDVTVSLPPWLRTLLKPLHRYLTVRLLMVGCIVGDGQLGVPDLHEVPDICAPLDEALTLFSRREKVHIVLFKDFVAADRPGMAALTRDRNYTRLPSLPAVKLDLNFADFEEYVETRLGKSTRKSLRRKFREVDNLTNRMHMEVKSHITYEEANALHALYEQIARRGEVQFEVFTPKYFFVLGRRMPDQARFFIWRWSGQIIAFSFCTVCGDTIYDNDLGMDQTCAVPLHLYHVTFRDIVRWALDQGLSFYRSSPFNYEPKLRLRMDLVPLDLYVRHTSRVVNCFVRWFAPLAAPTRQEPLLRHFPNAAEL